MNEEGFSWQGQSKLNLTSQCLFLDLSMKSQDAKNKKALRELSMVLTQVCVCLTRLQGNLAYDS